MSHQEFSALKQSNSEANSREEVLKKLAAAHDSYIEISSNIKEGTKVTITCTNISSVLMHNLYDVTQLSLSSFSSTMI